MKRTWTILFAVMPLFLSSCVGMRQLDTASALQEISNSNIENKPYADEDKDWKISPIRAYKLANYHAPTPISHPTAHVITTYELSKMVTSANKSVVVNVNGSNNKELIPTSVWLNGFGRGSKTFDDKDLQRFSGELAELTNNDKTTPLAFHCMDSQCWLSYNASLRASEIGYTNIYWYRGGIAAWKSAGLPIIPVSVYSKQ